MPFREKSDYFRKELLSTLLFKKCESELHAIRKQRFYYVSRRERIKKRAEKLWKENPGRSDLDNWLEAEKQIIKEDCELGQEINQKQRIIHRCLMKFYHKNDK
tara:strand:+ start:197 stop:505 length:309 start_codon:yes stop_codon:yes gene_type:complete